MNGHNVTEEKGSRVYPKDLERRQSGQQIMPMEDLGEYLRNYAREKPEAAALWCFGIGFVLGWRLKPW